MLEKNENPETTPGTSLPYSFETENSHITARRCEDGDSKWIFDLQNDVEVAKYLPWDPPVPQSPDDVLLRIEKWKTDGSARYIVESDGIPCGSFDIWSDPDEGTGLYTVCYALLPEYRGQGIIGAVFSKVDELLEDDLNAKGIVAYVDEVNLKSKQILEGQGLRSTGKYKDVEHSQPQYKKLFEKL
jgi:RimJ/RimL family protein N-acetyltransferase